MAKQPEENAQVRIYKREHDILRRMAVRRSLGKKRIMSMADLIRQLIKGV
jgi:hypothetical protein